MTTYSVGNAVIKYKEGFIFNSQYGGERVQDFPRPLITRHLPELSSDSETLHRMDQDSSKRNVPIADAALLVFQPWDVRDLFLALAHVTYDKYQG